MHANQHPIGSGFTAASTAREVLSGIDLTGRTAIVTGGHSGVGLETTRALRAAGAEVIVPVRSVGKGAARVADIPGVVVDQLDLSDPTSIDAFAERFRSTGTPLSILINSAGIMGVPLSRDARGNESHFATNHLGHFRLVGRLWSALAAAGGARVVNVSAWAHRLAPIDFGDLAFVRRDYQWMPAYGQSKTANILHAVGITARGRAHGIEAFACHPGSIPNTDLSGWATPEMHRAMGNVDEKGNWVVDPDRGKKTPQQGAATQTWLATDPRLSGLGGTYGENTDLSRVVDESVPEAQNLVQSGETPPGVARHALDPALSDRLWAVSQTLTD